MWKEFTKRGVEVSLPKTGNHSQLFATSGMVSSATKDQVIIYISKMMVQFLVEYEDSNGKKTPTTSSGSSEKRSERLSISSHNDPAENRPFLQN